ncbi:peptidase dimerization domain-containing protein [Mesorhizobium muleiense]|uniref:peptidase dimerization domain-containing protein n=1 Tax=Mesorhizobium muleiense TaxID=1004279 RepID=UPI0039B009F5
MDDEAFHSWDGFGFHQSACCGLSAGQRCPPALPSRRAKADRHRRRPHRRHARLVLPTFFLSLRAGVSSRNSSIRPGIDFNGIVGGNIGPGERSVLPSSATARLSFRLVGGQRPEHIRALFRNFVEARLPAGCQVVFEGGRRER